MRRGSARGRRSVLRVDQHTFVHSIVVFGRRCFRHRRRFKFARHDRSIHPRPVDTNLGFMNVGGPLVLGDTWLRTFYSVFDILGQRLGFARAVDSLG